jgi:hypothetical protein
MHACTENKRLNSNAHPLVWNCSRPVMRFRGFHGVLKLLLAKTLNMAE